jgi:hypothetical protein
MNLNVFAVLALLSAMGALAAPARASSPVTATNLKGSFDVHTSDGKVFTSEFDAPICGEPNRTRAPRRTAAACRSAPAIDLAAGAP